MPQSPFSDGWTSKDTFLDGLRKYAATLTPEQVDAELERKLNKKKPTMADDMGKGLPPVPHPPLFRPQPQVIGGKGLQEAVKGILKIAPELTGQFKSIGHAPTAGVMSEMYRSDIPINRFANTTLLGLTDRGRENEVWINPNLEDDPFRLKNVVGHELSHVAGGNESEAQETEMLLEKKFPRGDIELPLDPVQALMHALKKAGINSERR